LPSATTSDSRAEERAGRPRLVAGIVAVAFFMQMIDGTIIATSLPAMAADFRIDAISLNVGFTAYLLAMAIFIAPSGWLAERFGARRVFLLATILFTAASLACATAGSLTSFTLARVVQGAAAALMAPVGRQLVLRGTQKHELVRTIAIITWPALIAPVVGPLLGGFITTHVGWRWNFLINLPIGIAGALLIRLFIPADEARTARRFDWAGFALSAGALAALVTGLELFSHEGRAGLALALVAAATATGMLAIRHMNRSLAPLLDLKVLQVRTFALSALSSGILTRSAINATPFLLPLLLQIGFGLDAIATGSLILVYFLGNLAMKAATTGFLRLLGFRTLLVFNGVLASALVACLGLIGPDTGNTLLWPVLFAAGLTRSMQFTALNTIAFADIEARQRGDAATISAISQQISQLLSIAGSIAVIRLIHAFDLVGPDREAAAFALALMVMGAIGIASSLAFLRLPADAGHEVSGRRA